VTKRQCTPQPEQTLADHLSAPVQTAVVRKTCRGKKQPLDGMSHTMRQATNSCMDAVSSSVAEGRRGVQMKANI